MVTEGRYRFELLGKQHDRAAFSCGVEALDRYLREQAGQDQRRQVAVPYVLVETATGNIVGYYTLSMATIAPTALPEQVTKQLPRYKVFPAVLLGRLAVDRRYRGQGFGDLLLAHALKRALAASTEVAAMAVVVDAKGDEARAFYERRGFVRFLDDEYRLYLTMRTIAQLTG